MEILEDIEARSTNLFHKILRIQRTDKQGKKNFTNIKNKRDIRSCFNYREIKLGGLFKSPLNEEVETLGGLEKKYITMAFP